MESWYIGAREEGQRRIIRALWKRHLTFTELLKETNFSKPTLSNNLRRLQEAKVVEKQLDESKRVVYAFVIDPERFYREFKETAFDLVLELIYEYYPQIGVVVEKFIIAILKTRLQTKFGEFPRSQFKSVFLKNLNESLSPEDAKVLGLPYGVKLFDYLKEKGVALK